MAAGSRLQQFVRDHKHSQQTTNLRFSRWDRSHLVCEPYKKQLGLWQKVVRKLVRVSPLKRQADTFINLGLTEIDGISPVIRGSALAVPIPA